MVLVLLSTYNGSLYIKEFLDSLAAQTYGNWQLWVRDDGSSDHTVEIIKEFFGESSRLVLLPSKSNIGAKKSFNMMVKKALLNRQWDAVMFADQDDVWKPDKIECTFSKMRELQEKNPTLPILVHTDMHVTNADLEVMDRSLWHYEHNRPEKTTLNYLLYQNTATGCSMMLNRSLLEMATPVSSRAIMHDWWYTMVASVFGVIGIVHEATLYYRQHHANAIGAKAHDRYNILPKIVSLLSMKNEPYLLHLAPHREQAKALLDHYGDLFDDDTVALLGFFIDMPQLSWFQKRLGIIKYRCLRQSMTQNISLFLRV